MIIRKVAHWCFDDPHMQVWQHTRDESSYGGCMVITLRQYEAGEVIVQENDFGDTAYLIEQGQVEVSKELDGQTVHLAYLGAGEIFGEMSMIDEKPRSATVTAVTETVVSALRRDDFFHSFQTDPKVALALNWLRVFRSPGASRMG